jgi:hypothetical protein
MIAMSFTNYVIDSALVLLVLLQIKERPLTTRTLIRPFVIVSVAVVSYLNGVPTAGNDFVLVGILALVGALIGIASGQTVKMRRGADGEVLSQARWASAFFWILGMGSRFGFLIWINASGGKAHNITSGEAWTVALLAMAVLEVVGRSVVMALRRHQLQFAAPAAQLA